MMKDDDDDICYSDYESGWLPTKKLNVKKSNPINISSGAQTIINQISFIYLKVKKLCSDYQSFVILYYSLGPLRMRIHVKSENALRRFAHASMRTP